MGPEILPPDSGDTAPTSTQDIEFALVLSRVIDSVRENPEYLRATIYELARHKLQEQFGSNSFADTRRLSKSLEIAIQGVEAFHRKKEGQQRHCWRQVKGSLPCWDMLRATMSRPLSTSFLQRSKSRSPHPLAP